MPTRNINLTDHLDALVQDKVVSGRYQNASEVVRDALRLLEERDAETQKGVDAVREKIAAGLASLERGEFEEGEGVFARLRKRSASFRAIK